jgi:ankyrin repeat protein
VLLEHKADYNKEDVFGSTPLLLAVENEQEKIAKLLLDHGVDVNAKTSDGWNAMRVAFLRRSVKMARLLRDYGAISSLNITAMIGDGHEMKKQLDEVANFQECGFLRRPPIITAAEFGNAGAVKALISYGVDPNSFSENGWTPLIAAARHGHLETVSLLIDNGADVNAQNMYGESALIWAVRKGNIAMSKLLIENGARLQATTANGWEPIMWAAWLGHADMLKYLLKTRETIKTSEFNCKRALWIAETSGRNITKIIKEYVDTHKSHLKNNIILKP